MNSGSVAVPPRMKDFVLTDKLGSGSFATVYKAFHNGPARNVVAVKCIERRRLNKMSMENLLTEIEVMKGLNHKHIVQLLDFEWDEQYIFLIMEYCGGGDLSSFIKSRRMLTEKSARKFLRQLASALQFLRIRGVAHMDLKPQNLLLTCDASPVLKVGDFGMAQLLQSGDHGESFRGSPLYMAPEIMLGQSYDAKVDLWSVGVILYEALFGMAPFASHTMEELEDKVLDQKPVEIPMNPPVSDGCRDLLQMLLRRDPHERMPFDHFFDHVFIDLEHLPGPECLTKAKALVLQAVAKDSEGKVSSAVNYYCQSLEYFIPALESESDDSTRESLYRKIQQYISRAEQLKEVLRSKRPMLRNVTPPARLLEVMKADNPKLQAALVKAGLADELEVRHDYKGALDLYKDAVGILIPLIEDMNIREQKELIKAEAQVYLTRAEELNVLSQKATPTVPSSRRMDDPLETKCKIQ